MTAKEALQALIDGKKVARKGSRGHYMYLANGKLIERFPDGTGLTVVDFSEDSEQYSFEIVPESILDRVEKDYLSAVIKPFRKNVDNIKKIVKYISNGVRYEAVRIETRDGFTTLPVFKENKMYKGMEQGKGYTLEELGL